MHKTNELIDLLTEVIKCVEEKGYAETVNIIKSSRPFLSTNEAKLVEFIIAKVCATFCVSRAELLNGISKNYNRRRAKNVCAYVIECNFNFQQSRIGEILNDRQESISRAFSYVRNLNPMNKHDSLVISRMQEVERAVAEYRAVQNTNNPIASTPQTENNG